MEFKAYGKTKNAADGGFINKYLSVDSSLMLERYIATEKLDGTNLSIMLESDGSINYGKRSSMLAMEDSFFDFYKSVHIQYYAELMDISTYCVDTGDEIRIYGELFGEGVQRRIDYGPKKFLPFQLEVNGERLSPYSGQLLLESIIGRYWWAKTIAIFDNLNDALKFDVESYSEGLDRPIEGVIIEPLVKVIDHETLGKFKLKLKTQAFCDIMLVKKKKPTFYDPMSNAGEAINNHYISFFNDNRMMDLESKEGRIEESSQMGQYIKALVIDAREDFLESHRKEFLQLEDYEKKRIMGSGGKLAAEVVKRALFNKKER